MTAFFKAALPWLLMGIGIAFAAATLAKHPKQAHFVAVGAAIGLMLGSACMSRLGSGVMGVAVGLGLTAGSLLSMDRPKK